METVSRWVKASTSHTASWFPYIPSPWAAHCLGWHSSSESTHFSPPLLCRHPLCLTVRASQLFYLLPELPITALPLHSSRRGNRAFIRSCHSPATNPGFALHFEATAVKTFDVRKTHTIQALPASPASPPLTAAPLVHAYNLPFFS